MACSEDPMYFITYYCMILPPSKGLIPFHMYDHQRELIRTFEEPSPTYVAHSRQIGVTQLAKAYLLWYTLFHPEKASVSVFCRTNDDAAEFLDGVRAIYNNIPELLMEYLPKLEKDTSKRMVFDNGGSISTSPPSIAFVCGRAITLAYFHDFAFYRGIEKFKDTVEALIPTMYTGGKLIMSSGVDHNGMFNKIYMFMVTRFKFAEHTFAMLPWTKLPRDASFKEDTIDAIGEEAWKYEYECNFYKD